MRPWLAPSCLSLLLISSSISGLSGCGAAAPAEPVAPVAPSAAAPVAQPLAPSAPPAYRSEAELAAAIDAYVGAFGKNWGEGFQATGYVAVAKDGKVVYGRPFGFADRSQKKPADADTRFRIGSLTKQFTAVGILRLVDQGKLSLRDSIVRYLPEAPNGWTEITLHHLLTHTSGIPSYTDVESLMRERDRAHGHAEILASFVGQPLHFRPGEKYEYSNSNYYLLGMVAERASGEPYDLFMQHQVFGPAGMLRTSTVDSPDAPDTAVGYSVDPEGELVPTPLIDMSVPFAAGSLRSTVNDLIAWDQALYGDALLTPESKKALFTPFKDDYAYGFSYSDVEGHEVYSHSGSIDGFSSYAARVPKDNLYVVALMSSEAVPARNIGKTVLGMVLTGKWAEPQEERPVVAFDPAEVDKMVGLYRLTDASLKDLTGKLPKDVLLGIVTMTLSKTSKGGLFMKPLGQSGISVFRGEDGSLFTKRSGITLVVKDGKVTLRQAGLEVFYERAPEPKNKGGADPLSTRR